MTQFDRAPSGPDPIEVESYRILRSRIDLAHLPPLTRAVTERVIHASADFDYGTDLICDESALAAGVAAITRGAPVVTDVGMVAAGITGYPVICKIGDSIATRLARTVGITVSAAATRLAFGEAGPGAVWVVGCAPTALEEILRRDVVPGAGDRSAGRLRRGGRGQGGAAGQWPARDQQRFREGRLGGRRRRVQRPAPHRPRAGSPVPAAASPAVRPRPAVRSPRTSRRPAARPAGRPPAEARRRRQRQAAAGRAAPAGGADEAHEAGSPPGRARHPRSGGSGRFRGAGQAAHRPGGQRRPEHDRRGGRFHRTVRPAAPRRRRRPGGSRPPDPRRRAADAVGGRALQGRRARPRWPARRHAIPASPSGTAGRSARIRSC